MEYREIKGVKHYVFDNESEFNKHFNNNPPKLVKQWRNANEGDWVLSDDNRIIQLLKKANIRHPNNRRNYKYYKSYVRTVVGTFLCMDKTYMDTDFSEHQNRYLFSKTIKDTKKRIKERENITKKEKIFATNIAVGAGAVKSYMDAFSETDSYKAEKKAAILLKQERVMKEIEKSVVDVAKTMGIDHEFILERLKRLVDNSPEDNIVLNAVKELGKAIGTLGGVTVKQRESGIIGLFQGFQPEQLESAKRPNREIDSSNALIEEQKGE